MEEDAYMELEGAEYVKAADSFRSKFHFHPSYYSEEWPSIREPKPSFTWSLLEIMNDPIEESMEGVKVSRLQSMIEQGISVCTPPGGWVYSIDWYHEAIRFQPRSVGGSGQRRWPGSIFPDGDYYIYVSEDLSFGTFAHPWEKTLCIFGGELISLVYEGVTAIVGSPVRRDGHHIVDAE
ncbi:DUF2716 domain-containing protein [Planomonospora sp. ID67723]|uniref:DUF2716 domain-containing protein n=1 Tax=Planomonospora sp. ID67723 TaxID=2738134 RepID=UPI0018C43DB8|nr:DUF2716 domain-containing protein [Planomonospora sp. ID67723]MBG0831674.1 DUF2716 domain-containing protein [Planomonospora sp. ID67723]